MQPVFDPSTVHHLKYKGAVDADGHVLEDAGLWDHYIEARYRDRALRLKRDADGLEYLEIAGQPSKRTRKGDPDERTLPAMMKTYGADRFFWASDYPHPDHTGDYLQALEEIVHEVPAPVRAGLLGGNVRRAFGF